MPTIALKLTPLDVLFFRDSRPFGQADSAATGLPTPQTFHGLVKTHLARAFGLPFDQIHGLRRSQSPNRWISNIETRGVWLYKDGGIYVRTPSNIVQLGKVSTSFRVLRPVHPDIDFPGWDKSDIRPLWYNEEAQEQSARSASGFMSQTALTDYLQNEDKEWHAADFTRDEELFSFENRVGIGVDPNTRLAADGQIYMASFLRLKPQVSFYGEISAEDSFDQLEQAFNQPQVLPWGGEGRQVLVERCNPIDWPRPPAREPGARLFSVLITPGIFGSRDATGQNGHGQNALPSWRPAGHGNLRAAAVGKPIPISGWSLSGYSMETEDAGDATPANRYDPGELSQRIQSGRPKPTRYAAAPGSVYFWQIGANNRSARNGKELRAIEPMCNKPIESAVGWGMSLTGSWSWFTP